MARLNFTQPFSLTVPDAALTTSNGEAAIDLTPASLGGATVTLSNVTPATGRAALDVPAVGEVDLKSDTHMLGPVRVDLIDTATGTTYSFCPGFAGTIISAALVLDGAETTVGTCGAIISITGGAITLSSPLTLPLASAAGSLKRVTTTGGSGLFAATDILTIETTSANTAATFGGITLGVTRS